MKPSQPRPSQSTSGTAASAAPSRRCRCQSSGRVSVNVVATGEFWHRRRIARCPIPVESTGRARLSKPTPSDAGVRDATPPERRGQPRDREATFRYIAVSAIAQVRSRPQRRWGARPMSRGKRNMPNTKTAMLLLAGACTLMPQLAAANLVTFDFNGALSDPGSGVTASKSISSYSQNDPILGSLTLHFSLDVLAVHYGDNVHTGPREIIFFDPDTNISFLAGFKNPIKLDI